MVKRTLGRTAAPILVMLSLSGCAGVNFYNEPTLKTQTGIPVYGAKPYLLVTHTGAQANPVSTTIVYLPDTDHVIYAEPHSGFGSANLTLSLVNGQMTSFGQQTDTQVPALMTALSGMVTAGAGAVKTAADAASVRAAIGSHQAAALTADTATKVLDIAKQILRKANTNSLPGLLGPEIDTLRSVSQALTIAGNALANPANNTKAKTQPQFDSINTQADILGNFPAPSGSAARINSLKQVQTWAGQLNAINNANSVTGANQPENAVEPTFELYEIHQQSGRATELRRVLP